MRFQPLFDVFKRKPQPQARPRPRAVRRAAAPVELDVDGLAVALQRKPMRTLRLSLDAAGNVRVSAPLRTTDAAVGAFVRGHRAWIASRRARVLEEAAKPRPEYLDGDALPFFGGQVLLRVRTRGKVGRAVAAEPGVLELRVPEGATRERRGALVRRWLGAQVLAEAKLRLPAWRAAMGSPECALKVRFMRSRWGSCDARRGVVTLAGQLAQRPFESLDYVLVHELAHFKVRSHGVRFKAILDRHLPDWRERRRRLNAGAHEGGPWEA